MSIYEKLIQEFSCAIKSVYGEECNTKFDENTTITDEDLIAIVRKVKFYLD